MIEFSKMNRLKLNLIFCFLIYSFHLFGQPIVTGINPLSGPVTGGQTVSITGNGFTGTTEVSFGSLILDSSNFNVIDDFNITANIPSSTNPPVSNPAVVDVRVTTPSGVSSINQNDRYTFTNGNWMAYVANAATANVYTSNISTKSVDANIAVGSGPSDVLTNFDASTAYVTNSLSNSISVIDTRTQTVTNTIDTQSTRPVSMALSFSNSLNSYIGYTVDNGSNTVTQINLSNGQVLNTLSTGISPTTAILDRAYDPTAIYVTNSGSNSITRIDLSNSSSTTIDTGIGSIPSSILLSQDGSTAYFTDKGSNSLRQLLNVNTANPTLGLTITDPTFDFSGDNIIPQIAISSSFRLSSRAYAYVTNTGTNTVTAVDITDSNAPFVWDCPNTVGFGPTGSALTPDGFELYISDKFSRVVSFLFGIPNCSPTTTINQIIGTDPTDIAITSDQAPSAYFTVAPLEGFTNNNFTFDATLSVSPVGTIIDYIWDFGDGNTASGLSVTHSYATTGNYTVTLTVTNSAGTSTSATSFYNGQTMLRNGGSSAVFSRTLIVDNNGNTPTTTTVISDINPSDINQTVTFTATVAPGTSTLNGSVQFTINGINFGTPVTPDNSGIANITNTFATAGNYIIGASFLPTDTSIFAPSLAEPFEQLVYQDSTTTSLSIISPTPIIYNAPITFRAVVVADNPGNSGNPTGVVQFVYISDTVTIPTILGTANITTVGGVSFADFTANNLPVDSNYQAFAVYLGDVNHFSSASNGLPFTIQPSDTTTTITSDANPSVYQAPVVFTVTVTATPPGSGTPQGTVTLVNTTTGNTIGTAILDNNGQATFTTSDLLLGDNIITASYQDTVDNNYNASNANFTQTVNQASTITQISSNANPSVFGQNVIFTATVTAQSPATGIPTGTVTFFDGITLLGTASLDATGTATFNTTSLAIGDHTIVANYEGDTNYSDSQNSLTQTVNQDSTFTGLNSSPNPSVYGQDITFTAFVFANPPGGGIPTGNVTFYDDTTAIGIGTLDPTGTATFTTSTLTPGNHNITATYDGDTNYTSSTSDILVQQVNKETTSTTLNSDVNPSVFGQLVTFTATVTSSNPALGIPTGSVTFFNGIQPLDTSPLDVTGTATLSTDILEVGTNSITAVYNGDSNFANSTSPVLNQVVQQDTTTTTLVSNINPSVFGQLITLTSTVTANLPGSGIPTGTVTFLDGITPIGTASLDSTGTASLSLATLEVGSHSITAIYNGDNHFLSSTSNAIDQIVQQASTTTTLTSNINPSIFGQLITLTSTVNANLPGSGIPTGTVTFLDGITPIGTASLDSTGTAFLSLDTLEIGSHSITAIYNGDNHFLSSTSNAIDQIVQQASTTTTLTSNINPSIFGQPVTFTAFVTVNPPGSGIPTGTITFLDGITPIGTVSLDSTGTATLVTSSLSIGSHAITAIYSGNVSFIESTSNIVNQTINENTTTTTLVSSQNPSQLNRLITFTAFVNSNTPGTTVPTGAITFIIDGSAIATVSLTNGQASFSTSSLTIGNHTINAIYSGDSNYLPSSSLSLIQTITNTIVDPPRNIKAFQLANQFATQTDLVNIIKWKAPLTGSLPVAYRIYYDPQLTKLAAVVNATSALKYEDHHCSKHQTYYYIVSVDAFGNISTPIKIVIKGK